MVIISFDAVLLTDGFTKASSSFNPRAYQPPCYMQGLQPAAQAAQSHIPPGLEYLQGWGIHNLLVQPVPVCHHPLGEKLPPNI